MPKIVGRIWRMGARTIRIQTFRYEYYQRLKRGLIKPSYRTPSELLMMEGWGPDFSLKVPEDPQLIDRILELFEYVCEFYIVGGVITDIKPFKKLTDLFEEIRNMDYPTKDGPTIPSMYDLMTEEERRSLREAQEREEYGEP